MIELTKIVFLRDEKAPINFDPIRHLTPERLAEVKRGLAGGTQYHTEHDGYLTTIREYAPALVKQANEDGWLIGWFDEPCIAHPIGEDCAIHCSGRAIVGFYDPSPVPTRRPAYIVINTHANRGPLGMMLVQSA